MAELSSCGEGLSREHLVSKAILEFLQFDGGIAVSGIPWLKDGETKNLPPDSLAAKCLCRKHNSAIHKLDDAALIFFRSVKECAWNDSTQSLHYLFSGNDLERWLLKTLKAFAVSSNLSRERVKLSGEFQNDTKIIDMLDDAKAWPPSTGLYCVMGVGERMLSGAEFQITSLSSSETGAIGGLWTNIQTEPIDLAKNPSLRATKFRPGRFEFRVKDTVNTIDLSWDDGAQHPTVPMLFEANVQA
jgi:hypothetical protein